MNSNYNNNFNSPTFLHKDEFSSLKCQGEALDQKLKFRQEIETKYHQLKLIELDKDIEDLKYKNQIANKRNEGILNSIQGGIYKCYGYSKISSHSHTVKEKETKKYADYLSYQLSGIRNEFQLKLLAKQNELTGIKSVLQKQLNHNEQVLKLENDYTNKMAKMNEELADRIRKMQEKNWKVEEDRRNLVRNYSQVEEKTRETFMKILEDKENKDVERNADIDRERELEMKKENEKEKEKGRQIVINEEHLEEIIKRLRDKDKQEAVNNANNVNNVNNNNNPHTNPHTHTHTNQHQHQQTVLNTSSPNSHNMTIIKSIDHSQSLIKNNNNESISIIKRPTKENNNFSVISKPVIEFSHKKGVLDQIRKKKRDNENSKINVSINQSVNGNNGRDNNNNNNIAQSVKEREVFVLTTKNENDNENSNNGNELNLNLNSNSNIGNNGRNSVNKGMANLNANPNHNHNHNPKKFDSNLNNNNREDDFYFEEENIQNNQNNNKNFTTPNQISNTIPKNIQKLITFDNDINKNSNTNTNANTNANANFNQNNSNSNNSNSDSNNNNMSEPKKSPLEKLLQEKPDIMNIPKDFKLQVVKRLIAQIEKNIKGIKPNNAGTYAYQSKHMNICNKASLKLKFFEMLNDPQPSINTPTDTLIYLLLEVLNQNPSPNLIPDNLVEKDFNEQTLNNDIELNAKEIFELIAEHLKKVVIEKKTTANMAANILANSVINFKKDQRMTSNLVAVLERKLSQRGKTPQIGMMTGGWGGGFNSKNSFKYNLLILLESNANTSLKSMMNIRRDVSYNTTSNFNITKTNETVGIINNFTEIE